MQITTVILMTLKGHFFGWEQIPNQPPLHIQTKRLKNSLINHQQEVAIEYSQQLKAILACNRDIISVNRTIKTHFVTKNLAFIFIAVKTLQTYNSLHIYYVDKLLKSYPKHLHLLACIKLHLSSAIYHGNKLHRDYINKPKMISTFCIEIERFISEYIDGIILPQQNIYGFFTESNYIYVYAYQICIRMNDAVLQQ